MGGASAEARGLASESTNKRKIFSNEWNRSRAQEAADRVSTLQAQPVGSEKVKETKRTVRESPSTHPPLPFSLQGDRTPASLHCTAEDGAPVPSRPLTEVRNRLAERGGAKPVQGFYTANNEHKPKGEELSLMEKNKINKRGKKGSNTSPASRASCDNTSAFIFDEAELPVSSRFRLNDITLVFTFSSFPCCSFLPLHEKNPDDVTPQRLQTLSNI